MNNYQQQPPWTPQPFDSESYYRNNDPFASDAQGKSRGITALFAILLGSLGIHYFYLGKTTAGIISLILGLCSCGIWSLVTLIQGIMMFVMSNYDFDQKYVYSQSTFPLF